MPRRRPLLVFPCLILAQAMAPPLASATGPAATPEPQRMWMTVGNRAFSITLADTEAARAFLALLPLTLDMPDLNGNEKHVKLAQALPVSTTRPGTIRNGDLMLWGSDTLVVFYLTFESPYPYTRLGRIDDAAALPQVLGKGQVRAVFTKTPPSR